MLIDVIDVKPQDDYKLLLEFENGEKKEFDCKNLFGYKIYEPLKEKHFFEKARVEYGTVVWSDEIDIAPETLYLESSSLAVSR